MIEKLNLTMLTDYYEITMANGYFQSDLKDDIAVFDLFFRRVPDGGGYAIMAGLEQATTLGVGFVPLGCTTCLAEEVTERVP